MRGRRAIAAGGAALIALVVVVAFSIGRGSDDPGDGLTALDDTEGEGIEARCVVADPEGELILQPGSFYAEKRTRLVSVVLDDPENVEVIEGSVADYRGPDDLQGVLLDYPPRSVSFLEGLADWDSRRPIAGFVVRPGDGSQVVLVAIRLEDPEKPGHARGVTIKARTSSGPRTLGWEQLVLAVPDGEVCTSEAVAETTEWTG